MAVSGTIAEANVKIALKGLDAVKAQLASVGPQLAKVNEGIKSVGAASAKGFAAASASVFGFVRAADPVRWTIFTQKIEILSMYIGRAFIPIIDSAINSIDKITAYFRGLSTEQLESISNWTKITLEVLGAVTAFSVLYGIVGKVVVILGQFGTVAGLVGSACGKLGGAVRILGSAFSLLANAGPLKLIGILAAVAAAIFAVMAPTGVLDGLLQSVADIFKNVMTAAQPLLDAFGQLAQTLGAKLAPILTALLTPLQPILDAFDEAGKQILPALVELGQALADAFTQLAPVFVQLAGVFAQFLVLLAQVAGELLGKLLPVFAQLLAQVVSLAAVLISKLIPVFAQVLSTVLTLGAGLLAALVPVLAQIITVLVTVAAKFIEAFSPVIVGLISAIAGIIEVLVPPLMLIIGILAKVFTAFMGAFGGVMIDTIKIVASVITTIVDAISKAVEFIKSMVGAIKDVADAAGDFLDDINPFGDDEETRKKKKEEKAKEDEKKKADRAAKRAAERAAEDEEKKKKAEERATEERERMPLSERAKHLFGEGGGFMHRLVAKAGGGEEGGGIGGRLAHLFGFGKDKEKKGSDAAKFAPMVKFRKAEMFSLEEGFKRAQQGAMFDPAKLAERERDRLTAESAASLKSIDEKVTPADPAAGAF